MQKQIALINKSSLRCGKEKLYLTILLIIAAGVWLWFLFSFIRQAVVFFDSQSPQTGCYIKDKVSQTLNLADRTLLLPGEKCITWKELSVEERDKIYSERDNFVDKLSTNLTTPVLYFFFFLYALFLHYLAIAYLRLNTVRVGPNQYPELWNALTVLSQNLGMKKNPDLFIMLGQGVLNAFATRLVFRKFILVTSELAEALIEEKDQSQLEGVLAHELGHHLLGHTNLILDFFLLPFEFIPFLYLPLSRAREYSADRVMKAVMQDNKICERVFIKLTVGKNFGNRANIEAFLEQAYNEQGFFSWFAEKLSTHPFIPNRIKHIHSFQPPSLLLAQTPEIK